MGTTAVTIQVTFLSLYKDMYKNIPGSVRTSGSAKILQLEVMLQHLRQILDVIYTYWICSSKIWTYFRILLPFSQQPYDDEVAKKIFLCSYV